jgi:hypothetical protein
MKVIRRVYVHIPMLEAMHVLTYARYLKDILNQKRAIPKTDMLVVVGGCSIAILDGLLDKMGDLGVPTISYPIGTKKFDHALCDLRASMSIMPKVIYDQLNLDSLIPTSMHLQLADQLIWRPDGIAEDFPVRIMNSIVPMDFIVLEMDVCHQIPLILERPFLSTVGATIDVVAGIIKLNISGKEETFIFKLKGIEQCNQVMVTTRLEQNAMTPDKKPNAADNFSMKFSRCVKNATPTVTSPPVAPAT